MSAAWNSFSSADRARLAADSWVRQIETHAEVASTSDLALQRIDAAAGDLPWLVLAERQTAGRGRGNHRWWTQPGALTFSLVIEAPVQDTLGNCAPQVSLVTALAVCETIAGFVPESTVRVKWPNDVMVDGRKIAGILLERNATRPDRVVVGVGINVNNSLATVPEEVRSRAISMLDARGTPIALTDVLCAVLGRLAGSYARLASGDRRWVRTWSGVCYLRGRNVHVMTGDRPVVGICQGIDSDGALRLETESGVERLMSGTVVRIA